jgi:hypothetical protein
VSFALFIATSGALNPSGNHMYHLL